MKNKVSFVLLISCIFACMFSMIASAEIYEGECGNGVVWSLDTNTGVHTISGEGSMAEYSVEGLVPWYDYKDGIKKVVIGEGVKSIGRKAFYGCVNLENIEISSTVINISHNAFCGCLNLKSVTIPPTVRYMGIDPFLMSGIEKVYIEDLAAWCTMSYSSTSSGPQNYGDLYLNGEKITDLVIPDSVKTIAAYAFKGCEAIKSVTIPPSVESIGASAFEDCGIEKIYIEDMAAWCAINFKNEYSNPISLSFGEEQSNGEMYLNGVLVEDVVIPEGVEAINSFAFTHNEKIKSVTVPDSVVKFGEYVFYGSKNLSKVYIEDLAAWCNISFELSISNPTGYGDLYLNGVLLEELVIPEGVTNIGFMTFAYCDKIKSVTFADSVKKIDSYAFFRCRGLTDVEIPETVTYLGETAFSGCSSLEEIIVPKSVTYVGEYAFSDCTALTNAEINAEISNIAYNLFMGCSALKSVTIPSSVKTIENSVFGGCNSLTDVYYAGSEAEWRSIEIESGNSVLNKLATIHYNWGKARVDVSVNGSVLTIVPYNAPEGSVVSILQMKDGIVTDISVNVYTGEEIPDLNIDGADTVKVFIWKSFETMEHLCEAVKVK